jgi:hypothetical protein
MIRRSTVVYIIVLLVLAGAYYYLNNREPSEELTATPEPEDGVTYLFSADDGVPTSIVVESKSGETAGIERNEENAWELTLPVVAEAEQGASEAAASQVTTMRVLDTIPAIEPGMVGLSDPEYTLTVGFSDGTERTVYVGVVTPTESGYYLQDASGGDVKIVSKSSVDSVLRLLLSPPYLETPTPAVIPIVETPTPQ